MLSSRNKLEVKHYIPVIKRLFRFVLVVLMLFVILHLWELKMALVKDIIAGVFFLIDDVFRVGDYVEAGSTKGTVEHISFRSMN